MTVDSIIAELGGTGAVSSALALPRSTVSTFRARGKIPADLWAEIVRLAGERGAAGVTLEALAAVHARSAPEEAPT